MALIEKQLGQARENSTNAVSVYSLGTNVKRTIVKNIIIANTTSSVANFSLYHDSNGTTYDESTALFFDVPIDGKTTLQLDVFLGVSGGNIAYKSSVANALTITLYGAEIYL